MQGFGTELGLLNLALMSIGAAAILVIIAKVKLWLKTDWESNLKQHRKMWKEYVKNHLDDTGSFED